MGGYRWEYLVRLARQASHRAEGDDVKSGTTLSKAYHSNLKSLGYILLGLT